MSESLDPLTSGIPAQTDARAQALALSVLELTDCESDVLARVALAGSASREPQRGSEWSGRELSDAVDTLANGGLVDCAESRAAVTSTPQFVAAVVTKAQEDGARLEAAGAEKREALHRAILLRSETPSVRLGASGDMETEFFDLVTAHRVVINAYPATYFEWPNDDGIDDRSIAFGANLQAGQKLVDVVAENRLSLPREGAFFERVAAQPRNAVHINRVVPLRLALLDDAAAVVPLDPHDYWSGAIVVRDPDAVAIVGMHLAMLMATSRALSAPVTSLASLALSEREAAVVRLLSAGLTDDSIAKRLGVADRTVRRAVAELMSRVGADSRFALAVACVRHGLL